MENWTLMNPDRMHQSFQDAGVEQPTAGVTIFGQPSSLVPEDEEEPSSSSSSTVPPVQDVILEEVQEKREGELFPPEVHPAKKSRVEEIHLAIAQIEQKVLRERKEEMIYGMNSEMWWDAEEVNGLYVINPKKKMAELSRTELKQMGAKEAQQFLESDTKEFMGLVKRKALVPMTAAQSAKILMETPDRVMGMRFVRRWKNLDPRGREKKAKSRACILGHQDPDLGRLAEEPSGRDGECARLACRAANDGFTQTGNPFWGRRDGIHPEQQARATRGQDLRQAPDRSPGRAVSSGHHIRGGDSGVWAQRRAHVLV